jgi:hypothetical protein
MFRISGYFKDDGAEFENYLVCSDPNPIKEDDDVFYYGLNALDIMALIALGDNSTLEFTITSYKKD